MMIMVVVVGVVVVVAASINTHQLINGHCSEHNPCSSAPPPLHLHLFILTINQLGGVGDDGILGLMVNQ